MASKRDTEGNAPPWPEPTSALAATATFPPLPTTPRLTHLAATLPQELLVVNCAGCGAVCCSIKEKACWRTKAVVKALPTFRRINGRPICSDCYLIMLRHGFNIPEVGSAMAALPEPKRRKKKEEETDE
jgi:hypothetical protein